MTDFQETAGTLQPISLQERPQQTLSAQKVVWSAGGTYEDLL